MTRATDLSELISSSAEEGITNPNAATYLLGNYKIPDAVWDA